jgi:dTDP-4-amino-4,6-dideoxygalactose transaminase
MGADKARLEDLAVFEGPPAFEEPLHVGRPNLGDRQRLLQRIDDILESRWLTNDGTYLQEFERRLSELLAVRHCVVTCNATVALQIAIKGLALTGEVVCPSFTFVATPQALSWQGAVPVFCDIDAATHNIDPDRIEELITPRTSAILAVHLWGRPCNVEALTDIAARHKLRLLFDAAHALGSSYKGRKIGNFGDAEILSFHATKVVNSFEGGAIATNDDALAAQVRLHRNFGFVDYDDVASLGINAKMPEVCAAMGLTSLESMPGFVQRNYKNYLCYKRQLSDVPGVTLLTYDESESPSYQYIVIEIDPQVFRLGRDDVQRMLWTENILARRYFYPGCHRQPPYRSTPAGAASSLPATERIAERVLCLPTGTSIGEAEIGHICQIISFIGRHGGDIRDRQACASVSV